MAQKNSHTGNKSEIPERHQQAHRYEDVRHEMRVMREKYPSSRILFIAGDGLSLMLFFV